MFFGEMTMKKVLIAALLAGMSLSASRRADHSFRHRGLLSSV
ncbi:arginine ABC transporter substrate-binding protein [Klebsiella pneumoniae]|uniref:Arginine ABC transporter substrate-binding protein n=1 Tax=Klebsiella pneumoniae TaxID=573 RepID=A0A378AFX4_KLEPN|nr:arginine ABC transporter substrate-binding protein [Klebsiella pneumoniae]